MKTALVTGCSGGLGSALCSVFRSAGYRVIGTDRVARQSDCDGFLEVDLAKTVADPTRFQQAIDDLVEQISSDSLSVLVNNAAIQILGHVEEVTLQDWNDSVAINLTVPLFLTKALLPLLQRGRGTVINIGSVHAHATKPRFVSYATTKAALVGLTRAMAIDLAPTVRVTAINPAAVDTAMLRAGFHNWSATSSKLAQAHPVGRIATPQEVSRVVAFLASDEAAFLTGAALDLDGGVLSRLHDPE
jgi:NAD(P)-dependent dehydrogenase (short-subunit alcohol dehydrogenase family)